MLVELDGFDSSTGLVLLAATNRPEIPDPTLLYAGRFVRQVLVDRPDKLGRIQILDVHLRKAKLGPDVDQEKIAPCHPGFTAPTWPTWSMRRRSWRLGAARTR